MLIWTYKRVDYRRSIVVTTIASGRTRYGINHLFCYPWGLQYNSGLLCLEWRQTSEDDIDENNCYLLEFHRCTSDEFQCHYGMCISQKFLFDSTINCMDKSGETRNLAYLFLILLHVWQNQSFIVMNYCVRKMSFLVMMNNVFIGQRSFIINNHVKIEEMYFIVVRYCLMKLVFLLLAVIYVEVKRLL